MKAIPKRHWLHGRVAHCCGRVRCGVLAKIFAESSHKVVVTAEILAIVFIAWGIASLLYLMEKPILRIAAPVLLLIGLLIMIGGMINGSSTGIIAGGFLAVIGAVLMSKK